MKIALFFSRGIGVSDWVQKGMAYREFQIYNALARSNVISELILLTYKHNDIIYLQELESEGIIHKGYVRLLPAPKLIDNRFGRIIYQFLMPVLHYQEIKRSDLLKTNQLSSAIPSLIHSLLSKKPIYYRTGFSLIYFSKKQKKILRSYFWSLIQKIVLRKAKVCAAASIEDLAEYQKDAKRSSKCTFSWLPNFVDTTEFKFKDHSQNTRDRLIYIGRLNEQKNLLNLIKASHLAGKGLDIYGDGELFQKLKETTERLGADVRFFNPIQNNHIPKLLENYGLFALCSHYEGTPKTLIEAMSCGILTVVTPTKGINTIARTSNSVVAKSTEAKDLAIAISTAAKMPKKMYIEKTLKARSLVDTHYSLTRIVEIETQNLTQCLEQGI